MLFVLKNNANARLRQTGGITQRIIRQQYGQKTGGFTNPAPAP
jgi:hypothetical protein